MVTDNRVRHTVHTYISITTDTQYTHTLVLQHDNTTTLQHYYGKQSGNTYFTLVKGKKASGPQLKLRLNFDKIVTLYLVEVCVAYTDIL